MSVRQNSTLNFVNICFPQKTLLTEVVIIEPVTPCVLTSESLLGQESGLRSESNLREVGSILLGWGLFEISHDSFQAMLTTMGIVDPKCIEQSFCHCSAR